LTVFGEPAAIRGRIAAMRMVATAAGARPFSGPQADLVRGFAALSGCAGCLGLGSGLDFKDLVGEGEPWPDAEAGIALMRPWLPDEKSRDAAVYAGMMTALYAYDPDPQGVAVARRIALGLGVDDALIADVERIAGDNASTAKADVFRRMLSGRTGIADATIADQMRRGALGELSRAEYVERFHRRLEEAPEGSLGAEMCRFYADAGFDAPGKPGVPLPAEFLGPHDAHHVLVGYGTSAQGEVYTAVLNAFNSPQGICWLTVALLQWHQGVKMGVFPPVHTHLDPRITANAAERGSRIAVDLCDPQWDWFPLLGRPLDEVRRELGIPPGGLVGPGVSWSS